MPVSYYCPSLSLSFSLSSRAPELIKVYNGSEVITPEKIDNMLSADVYAFGVLISEILTGYKDDYVYNAAGKRQKLTGPSVDSDD